MSDAVFILETSYEINYKTEKPIPIPEIVEALKSLERILKETPAFLEKHYKGIKIHKTEVFVDELKAGSLLEKLKVLFHFSAENLLDEKSKESYDEVCNDLKKTIEDFKKLGKSVIQGNEKVKTVVAFGVGAIITWGIITAINSDNSSNQSSTTNINAYEGSIINIGSNIGLSKDDVGNIIDRIPNKKKTVTDAIKVISPAKNDENAHIEINGDDDFNISKDVVREVPKSYTPPMPNEKSEVYEGVRVFISASDKDNRRQGWAGSVYHILENRTKIILSETVSPEKLHGKTQVNANVSIIKRYNPEKKDYEVKEIIINSLLQE